MRPAGHIPPQSWMRAPETTALLAALTSEGDVARFVGGALRDAILGRPVRDVDIATTGRPEANLRRLQHAGIRAIPTGLRHGTVTAIVGGRQFEITTLRRDVETYGRHAKVAYTDDWEADAARRDFTINALYADPDGTLYDPTGGLGDLRAGRVRFIGDPAARIEEDRLRVLRFFRFHAWYGDGAPDAASLAACRAAAAEIRLLSGERIQAELYRLLAAPDPAPVIELMEEAGILRHLLPGAPDVGRLRRTVAAEAAAGLAADPVRRLAALLPPDPEAAARLAERLRLSNEDRDRLVFLAAPTTGAPPAMDEKALRLAVYRSGAPRIADLALLAGAPKVARRALALPAIRFPLAGADVLRQGVEPGPRVGRLLRAVENWWIEGGFQADRAACLRKLRRLVRSEA